MPASPNLILRSWGGIRRDAASEFLINVAFWVSTTLGELCLCRRRSDDPSGPDGAVEHRRRQRVGDGRPIARQHSDGGIHRHVERCRRRPDDGKQLANGRHIAIDAVATMAPGGFMGGTDLNGTQGLYPQAALVVTGQSDLPATIAAGTPVVSNKLPWGAISE